MNLTVLDSQVTGRVAVTSVFVTSVMAVNAVIVVTDVVLDRVLQGNMVRVVVVDHSWFMFLFDMLVNIDLRVPMVLLGLLMFLVAIDSFIANCPGWNWLLVVMRIAFSYMSTMCVVLVSLRSADVGGVAVTMGTITVTVSLAQSVVAITMSMSTMSTISIAAISAAIATITISATVHGVSLAIDETFGIFMLVVMSIALIAF